MNKIIWKTVTGAFTIIALLIALGIIMTFFAFIIFTIKLIIIVGVILVICYFIGDIIDDVAND